MIRADASTSGGKMELPRRRQQRRRALGAATGVAMLAAVAGTGFEADEAAAAKQLRLTLNARGIILINGVEPRTVGQISRLLGERPSARRPVANTRGARCIVRWRSAGLTLGTSNWDGNDSCADRTGNALDFTGTGRGG